MQKKNILRLMQLFVIYALFFLNCSLIFAQETAGSPLNSGLDKMVFIKGDDVFINYASDTQGLKITAILTFPNESRRQLELPISIKADQIGTYKLKTTALKKGYKQIIIEEQFSVIEREAEIPSLDIEEETLIEGEPTPPKEPLERKTNLSIIILIILAVTVVVIVSVVYYLEKKRR